MAKTPSSGPYIAADSQLIAAPRIRIPMPRASVASEPVGKNADSAPPAPRPVASDKR